MVRRAVLVPVLLKNMVYSDMELANLLNQARDDASVADDPRDIRPVSCVFAALLRLVMCADVCVCVCVCVVCFDAH